MIKSRKSVSFIRITHSQAIRSRQKLLARLPVTGEIVRGSLHRTIRPHGPKCASAPAVKAICSMSSSPDKGYARSMKEIDYSAPAELFGGHGRSGLRYRRFTKSAEAIRPAMEKLPAAALPATSLEVNDHQYSAAQIRALYDGTHCLAAK
jgi:hypothetical protein